MSRELDIELMAQLEEMMPDMVRSLRLLEPRVPGMDITLNQFFVLSLLARKEAAVVGELARQMGTTPGSITAMIDRLVRTGLVQRENSEKDRREVLVKLTTRGGEITERINRNTQAGMRRILRHIPDEKKESFFSTLKDIITAIAVERAGPRDAGILKTIIGKPREQRKKTQRGLGLFQGVLRPKPRKKQVRGS
jgi:DNA-binding MarR family transcriptional regulator